MADIVFAEKVAMAAGEPIELNMVGTNIPFTNFTPISSIIGDPIRNNCGYMLPRFAYTDGQTPVHYTIRRPVDDDPPFASMDIQGASLVTYSSSTTHPLGGDPDSIFNIMAGGYNGAWGGKVYNLNGGMTSNPWYLNDQTDQYWQGFAANVVGAEIGDPDIGLISTTPFEYPSAASTETTMLSHFGDIFENNILFGMNAPGCELFPGSGNSIYAVGVYDYYDYVAEENMDALGIRNSMQGVKYDPDTERWTMVTFINLGSDTFPVPDASARFSVVAAVPPVIGEEISMVARVGLSGPGLSAGDQLIYFQSEPTPTFLVNGDDSLYPTGESLAVITLNDPPAVKADAYTPLLDGLGTDLRGYNIQGTPDGFLVYPLNNPWTFYTVNRNWTTFQQYNVVKCNTGACTAHYGNVSNSLDAVVKWVAPGTYIILVDVLSGSPWRLVPGEPSEVWGGCIHEGGTGEGGDPPDPDDPTNERPQMFSSIEYGLDPAPNVYDPSPYRPPN